MENKKKIMIVDDEKEFLDAFKRTLEANGFSVVTAFHKHEAEKKLTQDKPDFIILGTLTPRGDAFHLHRFIREHPRFKDVPLIVIDAPLEKRLTEGWSMDEGVQMDADDYVTKPIEPSALIPRILVLIERASRRIKVLIVDDHTVVRDGLKVVLKLQKDIEVVGEAENGLEAVEKTLSLLPDVVIMDIVMPVMNGLEAAKRIIKERPETKVIMLTQYDDEENILKAEEVGAYGFIPKRSASERLISGIRQVYAGKRLERAA
ncbi:MAG: response regulator [Desulfobacterota bacterium]|nr:response regulator [Thermodesulfobacteriota bacterium]MDW8001492.1 response regulator [Deltaproteobacteria bacterium]